MNLHIHNTYDPVTKEITTEGVEPFIWDSSDSHANYTKASDMTIINLMIVTAPDYKVGRDYMKTIMLNGTNDEEVAFGNLAASDKPICAQHKLGTLDQRIAEIGVQGNIAAMIKYRLCTTDARLLRSLHADVWLQNELPDDKMAVLAAAGVVFSNYKTYGIEGLDQGDSVDGVDDYLNGKNGFAGNGLIDSGYVPHTMTLENLVNKLTGMLMNGEY